MTAGSRVLIAGESWVTHSIHQKGFDSFTTTSYNEGVRWLRAAVEGGGYAVDFLPNHVAPAAFPTSRETLAAYGAVILSDIGANTLLLHPDTFEHSMPMPNRLTLLRQYVREGGGLVMIGGYLTFQGIDGRARYGGTAVEEALPVRMLPGDDRVELPEGARPTVRSATHPIVAGLAGEWPTLLGYNRVICKDGAHLLVSINEDPLLVAWEHGRGRAVAFTSDCGPHWCPPGFTEWSGYAQLWQQAIAWVSAGGGGG